MAITITQRAITVNNRNAKVFDIKSADADTGPTTGAHGLGAIPFVWFTNTVSNANVPEWSVTADATNISISKNNAVGSGGAVPGTTVVLEVVAVRPSSLMK